MIRHIKIALALAALAFTVGSLPTVYAQDTMQHGNKPRPSKQALSTATCTRLQAAPRSIGKKTESWFFASQTSKRPTARMCT